MAIFHPFPPFYDPQSRILILGSFPSVRSRETHFYYGHPQNRFWKVVAMLLGENVPGTLDDKIQLLHTHHIALWDVAASCDITGSADSTMKCTHYNDIRPILRHCPIERIGVNGKTAAKFYRKGILPMTGKTACELPSTSPANAAWSLQKLMDAWRPFICNP